MATRKVQNLKQGDVIVFAQCAYAVDSVYEGAMNDWHIKAWSDDDRFWIHATTFEDALLEVIGVEDQGRVPHVTPHVTPHDG